MHLAPRSTKLAVHVALVLVSALHLFPTAEVAESGSPRASTDAPRSSGLDSTDYPYQLSSPAQWTLTSTPEPSTWMPDLGAALTLVTKLKTFAALVPERV